MRSEENQMGKTFNARIRFLPTSEGGRSTPAASGVRPHLKLGDILTSCIIRSTGPDEAFELGIEYEVTIEVIFWEQYKSHFREDVPIEIYDGSRLIARGTWTQ